MTLASIALDNDQNKSSYTSATVPEDIGSAYVCSEIGLERQPDTIDSIKGETHISVLLLLLRSIALRWQLICIHTTSLQPDIVKSVLIRDVDILLSRYQFYLNMPTDTLNSSKIDSLDGVGPFRTP
jgi:hypothetical protein